MLPPVADVARHIEEAALRAWPALADSDFDGWRLRFADGFTRRANSITPLGSSRLRLEDKVVTCERVYAERGLPTIFRLTPFAPPDLDDYLARRGYVLTDEVEVRARTLAPHLPLPPRRAVGVLRNQPLDSWLDTFESLSGATPQSRVAHRAVLAAVPGVRRLLTLRVAGSPVACGMIVLADNLLGLFDLVTAPGHRNRGYGSEMLRRALRWGGKMGAPTAYLQVLATNTTARRIYERAGFQLVYQYRYREKHEP